MVVNTIAIYSRAVLAIGFALFSSRWVLTALGQSDFGLFSVVGATIIFLTFLNGIMSLSTTRFFSYAIGQNNPEEVRSWFNSALAMHLYFAILLVVVGWPVGHYIVTHVLSIPPGRENAVVYVFSFSLCSSFVSTISVPYMGMFTAKQRLVDLSLFGTVQSVLTFTLAWFIGSSSGDRLVLYSAALACILLAVQSFVIVRATLLFPECRIDLGKCHDFNRIKQVGSFAGWSLFGGAGGMMSDQGLAVLINIFFGPRVNAAYGISNQVSAGVQQLSVAMIGAFSPEISRSEGGGEKKRVLMLANKINKFGTVMILLFCVPLLIEMKYVLELWLSPPPPYTLWFCRLTLVAFLIGRLTGGYMEAINAQGKIASLQMAYGTILMASLPLGLLFIKLGLPPPSVSAAFVTATSACCLVRLLWARRLLNVSVRDWIRHVVRPCAIVAAISASTGLLCARLIQSSFARLLMVCGLSATASVSATWLFAMDQRERSFLITNARYVSSALRALVIRSRPSACHE